MAKTTSVNLKATSYQTYNEIDDIGLRQVRINLELLFYGEKAQKTVCKPSVDG